MLIAISIFVGIFLGSRTPDVSLIIFSVWNKLWKFRYPSYLQILDAWNLGDFLVELLARLNDSSNLMID
jgi:hypothetical protein